ncbi:glycosyltransferase family 2 protein [Desulfotomaculum copahuensis]|uniref:Glycosyltransferase 2-like domain-containing protein n=1 Tax=Desulfotomaculum copahuensis TaxID=1838280 RepID=A0A1B7LFR1_9FIRM|nr:glycosyltransferase [Desulfotomaculum copahuensis]OAT82974.1 hypothetical protein A6M21_08370 [Desulfotomaculum copahuensis]
MLAAVIPVKNEAAVIQKVLRRVLSLPVDLVIPVLNGCTDASREKVAELHERRIKPLFFHQALGIDVPRAVGARQACRAGARAVLFVDGDMSGDLDALLSRLAEAVTGGRADLALTDCYPPEAAAGLSELASHLLAVRLSLNRELGLAGVLGSSSPSHGPHAVSRTFLERVPLRELAVPPAALALAAREGLTVRVAAAAPHSRLGSPWRDAVHSRLIAETIIGDCLEALCVYEGRPRSRAKDGHLFMGYHPARRFDLLDRFLAAGQAVLPPEHRPDE